MHLELIEFINKLQSYQWTGCKVDIQLPQIVVVGSQSSGKSSVLDGLIGASILPRGTGTVTKCPIIVQLINTTKDEDSGFELLDNLDSARKRTRNEVEIREKINAKMNDGKGAITDKPITVRVYSPNVVTLTVVDLPGVKRLVSSGEPSDMERRIIDLCRKYINEKNAIILAVSPANYDICNSDGLLLARLADPEGKRTIGVLTKLDLMDKGTDARDLLMGKKKDFHLKLGMIGLVNRSQRDVEDNLPLEKQIVKEIMFLKEKYPDLALNNGMSFLRRRLQEILVSHIVQCLPQILESMKTNLDDCEAKLASFPDIGTPNEKRALINRIIYRFETNVREEFEGSQKNPEGKYLYGGMKIKEIFEKRFQDEMNRAGEMAHKTFTEEMIINSLKNSGSYNTFFGHPEAVFQKLGCRQIQSLETPALKCAEWVREQTLAIAERNIKNDMVLRHFPNLKKRMNMIVHEMVDEKMEELKNFIKDYIRVQASSVISLEPNDLKYFEELRPKLNETVRKFRPGTGTASTQFGQGMAQNPTQVFSFGSQSQPATNLQFGSQSQPATNLQFGSQSQPANNIQFGSPSQPATNLQFGSPSQPSNNVKGPETESIKALKQMINAYFNHVKKHCFEFIPKLIADRLIQQFSSGERLGEKLRLQLFEDFEEVTKLPPKAQLEYKTAKEWKARLETAMKEVNAILENNSFMNDD